MELALVGRASFASSAECTEWTALDGIDMRECTMVIDAGPEDRIGRVQSLSAGTKADACRTGPDVDSASLAVHALRFLSARRAEQRARALCNHCIALLVKASIAVLGQYQSRTMRVDYDGTVIAWDGRGRELLAAGEAHGPGAGSTVNKIHIAVQANCVNGHG